MDAPVVHSRVEGEGEDHHEKKSVLKKVKAKAKKLKNSITGQHHGQDQEGHQNPDDYDLDEEDDEVDDPDVHGAPVYDSPQSPVIRKTDAPVQGNIGKVPMRTFGDTKAGRDEYDPGHQNEDLLGGARSKLAVPTSGPLKTPQNTPVSTLPHHEGHNTGTMDVDPVRTVGSGQGGHVGQTRDKLGKTDVLGEDTPLPKSTPVSSLAHGTHKNGMDVDPKQTFVSGQGGHADQSKVNLDRPRGLEEDDHAPKASPQAYSPSNYETKVNDPTKSGGGVAGVTPILHSFDKLNLHGDDNQHLNNDANQNPATGSHDQLSPNKPTNQSSSYTSAIADKAILAKNAVASKLGYGGTAGTKTEHDQLVSGAGKSGSSPSQHQNHVLDPSTNQLKPAETPQVRGTTEPEHNTSSDLKPPSQTGGTYTEKVSSATSAIAGRALSAKNIVATKLGYGPSEQVHDSGDVTRTPRTTPADQQGKPITSTMYQKVAGAGTAVISKIPGMSSGPSEQVHDSGDVTRTNEQPRTTAADQQGKPITPSMYQKVAGAGTAVMSKIPGMSSGPSEQVHDSGDVTRTNEHPRTTAADQQGKPITSTMYQKVAGAGSAVMSKIPGVSSASTGRETSPKAEGQTGQDKRQDKGVSVKDYFVEKLRPGEEDKALSEVISETVQKRKPGVKDQTGHSAGASPKGKVTESAEVKQRLGDTEGNDNYMTEKVKDSVGSMLRGNKNDEDGQRAEATGEHRRLLQESGN